MTRLLTVFVLSAMAVFGQRTQALVNQRLTKPVIYAYTVASLPTSGGGLTVGAVAVVTDAATAGSCTSGGGSELALCRWNGSAWASLGGAGSGNMSISFGLVSALPGTCTVAVHYYLATDTLEFYGCAATNTWRLILSSSGTGAGSVQFTTSGAMGVGDSGKVKIGAHTGNVLGVSLNGGAVQTAMMTDTVLAEAQEPPHDGDATNSTGDRTLALAVKFKTEIKSVSVFDPVAGDSGRIQMMFPFAITITRIACATKTATSTVTLNFDERAAATPDTTGTAVLSADLVADTNQQTSCASGCDANTITNAGIAARVPLALTITSVANSPTDLRCHVEYTID